ncbi:hemin uptake protein HemP [Roseinatronobacter sp. NSM]|uniref:hemin uptake protein HemP n=1 Tax=Roseinatronobacter sp. NSM TaxID=3457785 RepID=UPI004035B4AE
MTDRTMPDALHICRAPDAGTSATDTDLPCHDAAALTNGGTTAHIALDGQIYTLRITRTRKLILTK